MAHKPQFAEIQTLSLEIYVQTVCSVQNWKQNAEIHQP